MNKIRIILTVGFLVCLIGQSHGQLALEKANEHFENLAFSKAIPLYKSVLRSEDVSEAKQRLGDCYRLQNNFEEAEYWYAQVANDSEVDPIYKFYYAMALMSNGKCEMAVPYFQQYAKLVPSDPRGAKFAQDCTNRDKYFQNSNVYSIKALETNSPNSDIGPAFFKDGIIWASSRKKSGLIKRIHSWTGKPYYGLYRADKNEDGTFGNTKNLSAKLTTKYNDGPVSVAPDEKTIYFTRNEGKDDGGFVRLSIYTADIDEDGFYSNIKELPLNVNNGPYSVAHPAISADGKTLYFSSDMPGGYGGTDIYKITKDGDTWTAPENLGSTINTAGNEGWPYVNAAGAMFFASDGLGGLGGLDMFVSVPQGSNWSTPRNLGDPLNSPKDDFGLVINKDNNLSYFSSNRDGGMGDDDIYMVKQIGIPLNGKVVDCKTRDAIPGAKVTVTNLITGDKMELTADDNGFFTYMAAPDRKYEIKAEHKGYEVGYLKVSTFDIEPGTTLNPVVCLDKDAQPIPHLIGKLVEDESGTGIADGTIILRNTCTGEDVILNTDENGNFTYSNLTPDCEYHVQGSKYNYTIDAKSFTAPESGPTYVTLRISPKGVLAEYIIYYDLDKYNIRRDAAVVLSECLKDLKEKYPDAVVRLSSHTDSRASDQYNAVLSRNRTNSAAKWLASRGIATDRLIKLSFGESQLVNECRDGVKCDEQEHQKNRRTVIQIIPKD